MQSSVSLSVCDSVSLSSSFPSHSPLVLYSIISHSTVLVYGFFCCCCQICLWLELFLFVVYFRALVWSLLSILLKKHSTACFEGQFIWTVFSALTLACLTYSVSLITTVEVLPLYFGLVSAHHSPHFCPRTNTSYFIILICFTYLSHTYLTKSSH